MHSFLKFWIFENILRREKMPSFTHFHCWQPRTCDCLVLVPVFTWYWYKYPAMVRNQMVYSLITASRTPIQNYASFSIISFLRDCIVAVHTLELVFHPAAWLNILTAFHWSVPLRVDKALQICDCNTLWKIFFCSRQLVRQQPCVTSYTRITTRHCVLVWQIRSSISLITVLRAAV